MFTTKQKRVIAKSIRDLKLARQSYSIAKFEYKIAKCVDNKQNVEKEYCKKLEEISTHE